MQGIEIRLLETWDEMANVEQVQRAVWGDEERNIVHQHMLVSIARNGGQILGAFDAGRLVGCSIGFLGTDVSDATRPAMANLKLFSKRVGVLEAYRDRGVGYQLKLAQRDFAQQRGIRLITWTFDPLLSRNAYFNMRKLGAVASVYYHDYYGTESPSLTLAGSSDRLQADWWITSRRVERRLKGEREGLTLEQYLGAETAILNPTTAATDGTPWPGERFVEPRSMLALVEIPSDYQRIVQSDLALAQAWREHSREVFARVLGEDYVVTDFLHETYQGRQRSFYLLSHGGGIGPLSSN